MEAFRLSNHAKEERQRRNIPADVLESVLREPEQVVEARGGKKAYQSRFDFEGGKTFLVRAIVAPDVDPAVVVTVYRTSKIQKYWSES